MFHALSRRLNDMNLRDKMLLSFVVFMVLPLIVLGVAAIGEFRKATLEDALVRAEQGVARLEQQTAELLGVGTKIMGRLASDGRLKDLLTHRYTTTLEVFQAYHGFDAFDLFRDTSPDVAWIQAFAENSTLIDNWELRPLTPDVRQQPWFLAARLHPYQSGWFSWRDPTRPERARLSLVRTVHDSLNNSDLAFVVDLDTARLNNVLPTNGYDTYVLDPVLNVVAASRPDLVGWPLADRTLARLIEAGNSGRIEFTTTGRPSWVFVRDLAPEGTFGTLKVVAVVKTEVILGPADQATGAALLVLGLGTALALGFLWMVYTLFARRLEVLSRQLPRIASGDLETEVRVEGRDEIAQLAGGFNLMLTQLRGLMAEVSSSQQNAHRLEVAQGEIRLKMLASQIQPHFLFNVLESIRMKAHLKGEREIASTVKLLGKLMRRNLEASGAPMPLGEEFENVRCYLEIEKFRLEEKLEYQLIAGPGTESCLVPPLIVEPLVENAVIHGLERRFGGGRVTVTARMEGDCLHVQVEDNGLGMSPEQLAHVLDPGDGHHVGLNNIHQRIGLTYGPEYGLVLRSAPGEGTTVSFQIPARRP